MAEVTTCICPPGMTLETCFACAVRKQLPEGRGTLEQIQEAKRRAWEQVFEARGQWPKVEKERDGD